jgi:hypothetical protein
MKVLFKKHLIQFTIPKILYVYKLVIRNFSYNINILQNVKIR